MLNVFCLSTALVVGQGAPLPPSSNEPAPFGYERFVQTPPPIVVTPTPTGSLPANRKPVLAPHNQSRNAASPIITTVQGSPMPMAPVNTQLAPTPMQPSPIPKTEPKKNGSGDAEEKKNGDEKKEEEAKEDDKGYFMKAIAGTPVRQHARS